jgi:hypothetical protein
MQCYFGSLVQCLAFHQSERRYFVVNTAAEITIAERNVGSSSHLFDICCHSVVASPERDMRGRGEFVWWQVVRLNYFNDAGSHHTFLQHKYICRYQKWTSMNSPICQMITMNEEAGVLIIPAAGKPPTCSRGISSMRIANGYDTPPYISHRFSCMHLLSDAEPSTGVR